MWIGEDGWKPLETALEAMRPEHWNAADHVSINTIESGLKREEALSFRDNYVKNLSQMPGWSVRAIEPS